MQSFREEMLPLGKDIIPNQSRTDVKVQQQSKRKDK
jgi:hypothetical protein